MKITKSYLKQVIKEEITRLSEEEGVQQEEIPQAVKEKAKQYGGKYIGKIDRIHNVRYYYRGRPIKPKFKKELITHITVYEQNVDSGNVSAIYDYEKFPETHTDDQIMRQMNHLDAPRGTSSGLGPSKYRSGYEADVANRRLDPFNKNAG